MTDVKEQIVQLCDYICMSHDNNPTSPVFYEIVFPVLVTKMRELCSKYLDEDYGIQPTKNDD